MVDLSGSKALRNSIETVSYTHLRAHETDTYLFVGSVKMCIRDRISTGGTLQDLSRRKGRHRKYGGLKWQQSTKELYRNCLLYTSPSPRDGHLSIRRQRQDVYKRQDQYRRYSARLKQTKRTS